MRSAETSGVEAKGFALSGIPAAIAGSTRRLMRLGRELSPVTRAVATTALLAASLFVIHDVIRLIEAPPAAQHGPLVASLAAAGTVMPAANDNHGIVGVASRGGIAFAAAFLAIAVTLRRRSGALPDLGERERTAELISTIPFGVACWTDDGRLIACNTQYLARLRLAEQSGAAGASYASTLKKLAQTGPVRSVAETAQSRLLELERDGGGRLLIDERTLPGGGFVTLVTDLTERLRTDHMLASLREEQRVLARRFHEEKLRAEAASRSKTAFLAHLSHDIRTPLNHIIGFAEMMAHQTYGPLGDERYLSYVDGIRASGERLLGYFGAILELAELEGGRKALRQEPVAIDQVVQALVRRHRLGAARAGVVLEGGMPSRAQISGDPFAIERMLGNILDNALRFTPAGGKVTVAAHAAEDGVVLEVTDTGIGMDEARLELIRQPFAFGDAALTRQQNAAGLGIAISRAIAELSGGGMAIDSRPGLGTTVAISLPLTAAGAGVGSAAIEAA
jgi:two-component system cell cycle sensor histidine kinase PleC